MQPEPHKSKFEQLQGQLSEELKDKWTNEQLLIRQRIIEKNDFEWKIGDLDLVAGVDISASKKDNDIGCAVLVVYSLQKKAAVYEDLQIFNIADQPYVPGFLAFRQVPILYVLFQRLKANAPLRWPQLLLVDGNGILHSNQCGLACHLGVLVNLPTIGVGKTLFYIDGLSKQKVKQACQKQIQKAGDHALLVGDSGKVWGAALRNTQGAVNPIFVSIGHRIQLQLAIECVLKLSLYRVVEPIRLADQLSRSLVESWQGQKANLPKYPMIYL